MEYVHSVDTQGRPCIKKTLIASSGEEFSAIIEHTNEDERDNLTVDFIYEHMNNLLAYVKTLDLVMYPKEGFSARTGWPMKDWEKLTWAQDQVLEWWKYAYYRDEPEEEVVDGA
jgi:hypothetical protein